MIYVPFAEVSELPPLSVLEYSSPYGSLTGWVDHVSEKHVAIFDGTSTWSITAAHIQSGLLFRPEEGE